MIERVRIDFRKVANRRNAQRSTGPRTRAGKAVASQNARKHGLSRMPGPEWREPTRLLASDLARSRASSGQKAAARAVATAAIDLVRARDERMNAIADALHLIRQPQSDGLVKLALVGLQSDRATRLRIERLVFDELATLTMQRAQTIRALTQVLLRLARYQRRALSALKTQAAALDLENRRNEAKDSGMNAYDLVEFVRTNPGTTYR